MIRKSNAKPPQFGFFYLFNGYYISSDPIGSFISFLEKLLKKMPRTWSHKWDYWWRCKLRVPFYLHQLEIKLRFKNHYDR